MTDEKYTTALRMAMSDSQTYVVPSDEVTAWLSQQIQPVSIMDGHATNFPGGAAPAANYIELRRATRFLDVFHAAPGWDYATSWTYSHLEGEPDGLGDIRGETSLYDRPTGEQFTLGDGVFVDLASFAGREGDLLRVLGHLSSTGAFLVLTPWSAIGESEQALVGWFQDRGYTRALQGGCLLRPLTPGIDY
ncbi:hypothetical protein [Puerhibacterium sp. TATVAM-FAB25]|uniref:hypothetical protein n=1 Tax=Puerhibacterium sp. TATVAM-FAB25 TaxID=3093699 RepID=UPI00397C8867